MFKKVKRCYEKKRQTYNNEVQKYLKDNAFVLVQRVYNGTLGTGELKEENVKAVLGSDYPINPLIPREDVIGQFVSILELAGYIFCKDNIGKIYFKQEELYNSIVQNHLRFSGKGIFERLTEKCQETNGIEYEEVHKILGFHYPKAPYAVGADYRTCIILFLKEVGIPFIFDETHIYLP